MYIKWNSEQYFDVEAVKPRWKNGGKDFYHAELSVSEQYSNANWAIVFDCKKELF